MNTTYYFCSILHQYATPYSAYKTHNREKLQVFYTYSDMPVPWLVPNLQHFIWVCMWVTYMI